MSNEEEFWWLWRLCYIVILFVDRSGGVEVRMIWYGGKIRLCFAGGRGGRKASFINIKVHQQFC